MNTRGRLITIATDDATLDRGRRFQCHIDRARHPLNADNCLRKTRMANEQRRIEMCERCRMPRNRNGFSIIFIQIGDFEKAWPIPTRADLRAPLAEKMAENDDMRGALRQWMLTSQQCPPLW